MAETTEAKVHLQAAPAPLIEQEENRSKLKELEDRIRILVKERDCFQRLYSKLELVVNRGPTSSPAQMLSQRGYDDMEFVDVQKRRLKNRDVETVKHALCSAAENITKGTLKIRRMNAGSINTIFNPDAKRWMIRTTQVCKELKLSQEATAAHKRIVSFMKEVKLSVIDKYKLKRHKASTPFYIFNQQRFTQICTVYIIPERISCFHRVSEQQPHTDFSKLEKLLWLKSSQLPPLSVIYAFTETRLVVWLESHHIFKVHSASGEAEEAQFEEADIKRCAGNYPKVTRAPYFLALS